MESSKRRVQETKNEKESIQTKGEERYNMKVYIVWRLGYEGDTLEEIYIDPKKAENKTLKLNDGKAQQWYAWTEEDVIE